MNHTATPTTPEELRYIQGELLADLIDRAWKVLATPRRVTVGGRPRPITLLPVNYPDEVLASMLDINLTETVFREPAYAVTALARLDAMRRNVVEAAALGTRLLVEQEARNPEAMAQLEQLFREL